MEFKILKIIHMARIESKIGVIKQPAEKIFNYVSNFNNFSQLIPEDKVKDFESTNDTCRFKVEGIGQAGLRIIGREPHKLIKITSDEDTTFDLLLWIQIKEIEPGDSRMKITTEVNLNPMVEGMVRKPLKKFVDTLIDQAEKISYDPA